MRLTTDHFRNSSYVVAVKELSALEAQVAIRAWIRNDNGEILSAYADFNTARSKWEKYKIKEKECSSPHGLRVGCYCGLYSAKHLDNLKIFLYDNRWDDREGELVVGQVWIWGTVIEFVEGYKSTKATIKGEVVSINKAKALWLDP